MPIEEQDLGNYGSDSYIWRDGQRLRVAMIRTVPPMNGETNAQFERRMDGLIADLAKKPSVLDASYEFMKRAGSITMCVVHIVHKPMPACIAEDNTPAGGRMDRPRGGASNTSGSAQRSHVAPRSLALGMA